MLKALWRWLWPQDALPTVKGRASDTITEKDVRELLAAHMQDIEFEWTEMYEKFNTLHQRLAKREKRSKQQVVGEQLEIPENVADRRGLVLSRRRMGSI